MSWISKFYICTLCFLFIFQYLHTSEKTIEELLKEESKLILERSRRIADQFYSLEEGRDFKEITECILNSADTKESIKRRILATGRCFFLFKYPSDEFQVKGYISFVPNSSKNPLLIFLRGGNRIFGLMHPATDFTCNKNYTVIATAYRGGVSEGIDEYGGNEVNDIHNLIEYFPILQEKLKTYFTPQKTFILGASRGGMEMFLALNRFTSLQHQITKAASLSGLLDLRECMICRYNNMRKMFIDHFGLIPGKNEDEWIIYRNPLTNISNIRKDLLILILQGTNDLRIDLKEGHNMVKTLKANRNDVSYLEISGGTHCLANQPNRMDIITNWFEN